jgi:hypothetical protein
LHHRAFKITRRPPELRRVPRCLPPVTLFSSWNINSALLPPLYAFKQSDFPQLGLLYSLVIFENDVLFRKTDLAICHLIVDFMSLFNARFPRSLQTCQLRFQVQKLGVNFATKIASTFQCLNYCKQMFIYSSSWN